MATSKQIEANRRNAQKSTGPTTAEGKAAVAKNALTHGLYAANLLLPEEDPAKFEALRKLYYDNYRPSTLDEIDLVESIVADRWELNRLNIIKQGAYDKSRQWLKDKNKKPQVSAGHIFMEIGRTDVWFLMLTRIQQAEARIQRHCERAQRELRKLQQEQADQMQPEPEPEPEPETAPAPESATPEIPRRPPQPAGAAVPIEVVLSPVPESGA